MKVSDLISENLLVHPFFADPTIHSVCCHTDKVDVGCLFICKGGARYNPIYMLPTVEQKGAVAVVAEEGNDLPCLSIPIFLVHDIRLAEAEIWNRFYQKPTESMTLIGITGTNGKTSTAKILSHIFHSAGRNCGYIGTLGIFMNGLPLFADAEDTMTTPPPERLFYILQEMKKKNADTVVMEVSSHALAQKRVHGLHFQTAIFTNLTEDHLDYHLTMKNYFEEKKKLFLAADHAVINTDDAYGQKLYATLSTPNSSCGVLFDATYTVTNLYEKDQKHTKYTCITPMGEFSVHYPLFGNFNVYNTLLATVTALQNGVCVAQLRAALATLPTIEGRLETIDLSAFGAHHRLNIQSRCNKCGKAGETSVFL